jgi:hypothetical protein
MKKFLNLKCTQCHRDVDKIVDITHYTPDRCTITQGCEGRLQPLEYRSSAGIAVTPEVGVTDWRPRGSSTIKTSNVPTSVELINLETGKTKQLVIGSLRDEPSITLSFKGKVDSPKAYRAYVFRRETAFTSIFGTESGLEKKALRFNVNGDSPDLVTVYVNGVQRERGTGPDEYQLADQTSGQPPNTIVFNSTIDQTGVTQVDVIVSKEDARTTYDLTFTRNILDESRVGTGAYENVNFVEGMITQDAWQKFYLYTLDLENVSEIVPINSILVPSTSEELIFLLARRPYSQLDRYSTLVIPLKGLNEERDYVKYYKQDGAVTARVTSTSVTSTYPPLRFNKFVVEKPLTVATAGIQEQLVIDGKVITGPDS